MKAKPTIEQHREFGRLLSEFRERYLQYLCGHPGVVNKYSKTSPQFKHGWRLERELSRLKCAMDDAVCAENPDAADAPAIYYGIPPIPR